MCNRVGSVASAGPQVLVESTRTLLISARRPRQKLRKLGESTRPFPGGEASVRPKRKWKQGSGVLQRWVEPKPRTWKGLYQNTGIPFEKVKRESLRESAGMIQLPADTKSQPILSHCCEVDVGSCVEMHPDADYS